MMLNQKLLVVLSRVLIIIAAVMSMLVWNAVSGPRAYAADPDTDESSLRNDCSGENIRAGAAEDSDQHCGILDYLVTFINVLSGLAGVVIVVSIVIGGIQYSSAGSDASKVQAAKNRIRNAIIALLLFLFGYGILNYLVPGGVL